jgi:hypothetical protein
MASIKRDVRFTPKSGHWLHLSECFVPKADSYTAAIFDHSITSSAMESTRRADQAANMGRQKALGVGFHF